MPVLYYVRHGETDWNVERRLQGHRGTSLNMRGRSQALRCGAILRTLLARDARKPDDYAYVSSPLQRARSTMELMRSALGLLPHGYDVDHRLVEISFGEWEGLTLSEIGARSPDGLAQRERDKWGFTPPGGESYHALTLRVGEWYRTLSRDTVVAAHGGVARALIAYLGVLPEEKATHTDIMHGVVYVYSNKSLSQYS